MSKNAHVYTSTMPPEAPMIKDMIEFGVLHPIDAAQVDILFAGEGPDMRFVEVHDTDGNSVRIGSWHSDGEFQRLTCTVLFEDGD